MTLRYLLGEGVCCGASAHLLQKRKKVVVAISLTLGGDKLLTNQTVDVLLSLFDHVRKVLVQLLYDFDAVFFSFLVELFEVAVLVRASSNQLLQVIAHLQLLLKVKLLMLSKQHPGVSLIIAFDNQLLFFYLLILLLNFNTLCDLLYVHFSSKNGVRILVNAIFSFQDMR